ncbi:MAG: hypothetical protein P8Y39_11645 [Nitrospirota bacterium]|jgi:hypothetical protein
MYEGFVTVPKLIILLFLLFLLNGCLPIPHSDYLAPEISGVVQDGDKPVSDARVYLDATFDSKNCEQYDMQAETTEAGEFVIGPVKKFRWVVLLIGDPIAYWTLCVDTPEGKKVLLQQGGIGMSPLTLTIECDISSSEIRYIEAFGTIEGKCIGKASP